VPRRQLRRIPPLTLESADDGHRDRR
jgi:hypothetical protein